MNLLLYHDSKLKFDLDCTLLEKFLERSCQLCLVELFKLQYSIDPCIFVMHECLDAS